VTGANGFLGMKLVEALIKMNHHVVGIVRTEIPNINLDTHKLRYIKADLSLIRDYMDELRNFNPEIFYHLAWSGTSGDLKASYNIQEKNFTNTLELYQIANKLKSKKFIVTGTISENLVLNNNTNISPYSLTKYFTRLALNNISKFYETDISWVQLANLYGKSDTSNNLVSHTINNLISNIEVKFSKADHMYDFLLVDDAARALSLLSLANSMKDFYYLGSENPQILKNYIIEIASRLKKMCLIKFDSPEVHGHKYLPEWFDSNSFSRDFNFKIDKSFKENLEEIISSKSLLK
jgi:nucleoside-diphosphate-sugar epimerase